MIVRYLPIVVVDRLMPLFVLLLTTIILVNSSNIENYNENRHRWIQEEASSSSSSSLLFNSSIDTLASIDVVPLSTRSSIQKTTITTDGEEDNNTTTTTTTNTTAEINGTTTDSGSSTNIQCYDNLTMIHYDLQERDPFEMKRYYICSDTVYEIGILDMDGDCCISPSSDMMDNNSRQNQLQEPSQHAPFQITMNTEYICGDDGKSTNNCIINGGQMQVFTYHSDNTAASNDNIIFRGFTFQNAWQVGVFLGNAGNVTFIDCIFRDQTNDAAVILVYDAMMFQRRRQLQQQGGWWNTDADEQYYSTLNPMSKAYYDMQYSMQMGSILNDRDLQESSLFNDDNTTTTTTTDYNSTTTTDSPSDDSSTGSMRDTNRLVVTFDECVFYNNTLGAPAPTTQPGIVIAFPMYHDVIFKRCLFLNNNYNFPNETNEGFAVRIDPGSSIVLQDSCFLDNYFLGDGIVILNETANAIIGNNYVDDGMMSDLICSFAMKEESGECIQPDSDSCSLLGLPPKLSPEQTSTANNNNSTNPVLDTKQQQYSDAITTSTLRVLIATNCFILFSMSISIL